MVNKFSGRAQIDADSKEQRGILNMIQQKVNRQVNPQDSTAKVRKVVLLTCKVCFADDV